MSKIAVVNLNAVENEMLKYLKAVKEFRDINNLKLNPVFNEFAKKQYHLCNEKLDEYVQYLKKELNKLGFVVLIQRNEMMPEMISLMSAEKTNFRPFTFWSFIRKEKYGEESNISWREFCDLPSKNVKSSVTSTETD